MRRIAIFPRGRHRHGLSFRKLTVIDDDLDRVRTRMAMIESEIGKSATSRELGEVNARPAGLQAHMEANATTTRMLYEAAMRADPARSQK